MLSVELENLWNYLVASKLFFEVLDSPWKKCGVLTLVFRQWRKWASTVMVLRIQSPTWTIWIGLWKRIQQRGKNDRKKTMRGREGGTCKTLSLNSACSHLCIYMAFYASKWITEENHRKAWDSLFFKEEGVELLCNNLPDSRRDRCQDLNLDPLLPRKTFDSI